MNTGMVLSGLKDTAIYIIQHPAKYQAENLYFALHTDQFQIVLMLA